jgi:hypothetical protein
VVFRLHGGAGRVRSVPHGHLHACANAYSNQHDNRVADRSTDRITILVAFIHSQRVAVGSTYSRPKRISYYRPNYPTNERTGFTANRCPDYCTANVAANLRWGTRSSRLRRSHCASHLCQPAHTDVLPWDVQRVPTSLGGSISSSERCADSHANAGTISTANRGTDRTADRGTDFAADRCPDYCTANVAANLRWGTRSSRLRRSHCASHLCQPAHTDVLPWDVQRVPTSLGVSISSSERSADSHANAGTNVALSRTTYRRGAWRK